MCAKFIYLYDISKISVGEVLFNLQLKRNNNNK